MSKKPRLENPSEVRRRILHHLDGLAAFADGYREFDPFGARVVDDARAALRANPLVEFRGAGARAPDSERNRPSAGPLEPGAPAKRREPG